MPFEEGETVESLRAMGLSDEAIELRRKHHTPRSMLSPEIRADIERTFARIAELRRKGHIAKPREGDNFVPGYREDTGVILGSKPASPPPPVSLTDDHEWDGATLRTTYHPDELQLRDRIADAARDGHWDRFFELVGPRINRVRPGDAEGLTPLHQAALQGAPAQVVQGLIERGAWRWLETTSGHTAQQLAAERNHAHLAKLLLPRNRRSVTRDVLRGLEEQLHLLIRGRAAELVLKWQLRLPQLAPLTEMTEPKLWFPVPELYGGFSIELHETELQVKSWNRVVEGWARTHRVTRDTIQQL
ncbi:ankyrin repeat domain-containing protein [Amycolatopsis australiensis]|uniref:Uncharacterized protein n=1 Tax=Amycolatopsis australiensis TaxID=546364 RepID=A0A1K1PGQ1_9PSEU|nr:ankyrin repeat domain-containing protein [Amycolatopsis australiensis]SFW46621.1 hypothetical protein SAMN04489730_0597 [Amycolatopsis australiensis]